jgi:uncharacterized protein YndB with AHSA1/START domain
MTTSIDNFRLKSLPIAEAGMLIRKPAHEVYKAFINPEITTHFWFTQSSGRLEVGKHVRWDWEMYGASTLVDVIDLQAGARILVEWDVDENPSQVEWIFTAHAPNATFVTITNSGFTGTADQVVAQAMDSAAGFELVLAGLKAYLEHGIELHLVEDRFPRQQTESSPTSRKLD